MPSKQMPNNPDPGAALLWVDEENWMKRLRLVLRSSWRTFDPIWKKRENKWVCFFPCSLDHILLETTGLADPGPVAAMLWVDEELESPVRLDSVVTVVDARNLGRQLREQRRGGGVNEAAKQIAHADVVILNKVDLVEGVEKQVVAERGGEVRAGSAFTSEDGNEDLRRSSHDEAGVSSREEADQAFGRERGSDESRLNDEASVESKRSLQNVNGDSLKTEKEGAPSSGGEYPGSARGSLGYPNNTSGKSASDESGDRGIEQEPREADQEGAQIQSESEEQLAPGNETGRESALSRLENEILQINSVARVMRAVRCQVDIRTVIRTGAFDSRVSLTPGLLLTVRSSLVGQKIVFHF
jgi:G3E family GTPase